MAESTALEALTAELLGDVGVLHDQIKALREVMPNVADDLAQKLQASTSQIGDALFVQGGNYLAAAEKLAAVLSNMSVEIDRRAEQAAITAAESVQLDIREAARNAVRDSVGAEINQVVGRIVEATTNLTHAAGQAKAEVSTASKQVSWGMGRVLAVVVAGSILGGLVAAVGSHYLPVAGQGSQLSDADRRAIENGNKIQKVWNSLTQKERDHINDLLRESQ